MKRGDKVALACGTSLVILGITFGVLYFTGWLSMIKNIALLGGRGNSMVILSKRTTFTPPANGCVDEERLKAYVEVCCAIKPFGDKIDAWEEANAVKKPRGKGVFKGQAAGLVGDYLREFKQALEAQKMGPAEFAWIGERMDSISAPADPLAASDESDRILYGKYKDRIDACALGPHALEIATGFAK